MYYIHWCTNTYLVVWIVCVATKTLDLWTEGFQLKIRAFPAGKNVFCPPAAQSLCKALDFQQLEWNLLSNCSVSVCMCATHTIRIKKHPT